MFVGFRDQALVDEEGIMLSTGRTATCKDAGGMWTVNNMVALPVQSKGLSNNTLLVEVYADGPQPSLQAETMIWMKDVVNHVRIATEWKHKPGPKPFGPAPIMQQQVWVIRAPNTDAVYCKLHTYVFFHPLEPRMVKQPVAKPLSGKQGKLLAQSPRNDNYSAGVMLVRVISGTGLPNRELIGKQDPYVRLAIKHRQHPLNRSDALGEPQVCHCCRTLPPFESSKVITDNAVIQCTKLTTQSVARSATVKKGGSDPTWVDGAPGSEFRMGFDDLRSGDRVFLCLSVYDEDVGRDDVIGFGSVDVSQVALRDAGVPGSQVIDCYNFW